MLAAAQEVIDEIPPPSPKRDQSLAEQTYADEAEEKKREEDDFPTPTENKLLPKRNAKRPFATKSTGHKRRKLSVAPASTTTPQPSVHASPQPLLQPTPAQNNVYPGQPEPFMQGYQQDPAMMGTQTNWMSPDQRKDPDYAPGRPQQQQMGYQHPGQMGQPGAPRKSHIVDSFPTTGFPVPMPGMGQMQHPYNPNPMHHGGAILTGGYGAGGNVDGQPNEKTEVASSTIGFKWVECAFCLKWRKIPAEIDDEGIPQPFSCCDNQWDDEHNKCNTPQEDDVDLEDHPFSYEEMNAPLPHYPQQQENMGGDYNPYSYDPSGLLEPQHSYQPLQHPDEWEPEDDGYYYQKRKAAPRVRRKTVRNHSTVSLSNLLDNSEGVDPQYAKERKEFYQALETFLGRAPDVNLLCGAPVDLYQLFTETTGRGGYEQVCTSKQWREIFRQLPQYSQTHTSASYALKKMYRKNLLEYEQAQRGGGFQ